LEKDYAVGEQITIFPPDEFLVEEACIKTTSTNSKYNELDTTSELAGNI